MPERAEKNAQTDSGQNENNKNATAEKPAFEAKLVTQRRKRFSGRSSKQPFPILVNHLPSCCPVTAFVINNRPKFLQTTRHPSAVSANKIQLKKYLRPLSRPSGQIQQFLNKSLINRGWRSLKWRLRLLPICRKRRHLQFE